ncbi:MAG: GNAT family N-acetyltransferase [Chloroflexota bacterium]
MVTVALASQADLADITGLFHQIYQYYTGVESLSRDDIATYVEHNLFQAHCGVQVVLAREGITPLGIATFSIMYPGPNATGQLFMKELFTSAEARGKGAGKALMKFLARYAIEHGCSRFDWTAETTNPNALAFYDYLGAPRLQEKVYYRFADEQLRAFADEA